MNSNIDYESEIRKRSLLWAEEVKRRHERWARSYRGRLWMLWKYLCMGYWIKGWAALWAPIDVIWKDDV